MTEPVSTPSRWKRVRRRALEGLRFALGATLGLWVGDALLLLYSRGGATWTQWLTGIGAALFVASTTAAVLGCLLGPIVAPIAERVKAMVRTWWARLDGEGRERSRALASAALAGLVLTSIWSLIASRVISAILFGVARPDT